MKKTLVLAAVVIGVHCVAISGLFLVQGCKTTKRTTSPSSTPTMPPLSAPAVAPATIEPAPIISEKDTKTAGTIEYIVNKGDSLGTIAKKHNVSRSELIELNKIADPNKIRVGQKLIIPKRAHVTGVPAAKKAEAKPKAKAEDKAPATTLATGINEYVVQAGDSLSKISAKLNVKISELREVNKLVNDKLKVGQKLTVPAKKAEGAPESAPAAASEPAMQTTPAAVTPASAPAPGTPEAVPAAAPAKNVSSGITHTVLANEDLNTIAKLYVVSADDIVAANQMGTNRTVHAGQKIIIPQP